MSACTDFIERHLSARKPDAFNFAISVDGHAAGNVGIGSIERHHDTEETEGTGVVRVVPVDC